jgi:hypothetical protein
MRGPSRGRLRQQVDALRREFLQEGELPFADVLSSGGLTEAMAEIRASWKDRIFTPRVTLWVFLGQVLHADQSCRAAVARLIAHRVARGLEPCSTETGAYCQARKRLTVRAVVRGVPSLARSGPTDARNNAVETGARRERCGLGSHPVVSSSSERSPSARTPKGFSIHGPAIRAEPARFKRGPGGTGLMASVWRAATPGRSSSSSEASPDFGTGTW